MAKSSVRNIFGSIGLYRKSLGFYILVGALIVGGVWFYKGGSLFAETPTSSTDSLDNSGIYDINLALSATDGKLYSGNQRISAEYLTRDDRYWMRYQVIDKPTDTIDHMAIAITLPKDGTEDNIGHTIRQNGGIAHAESSLADAHTVVYDFTNVSNQSQASIELEVPLDFVKISTLSALRQKASDLPIWTWLAVSLCLPGLALILLISIFLAKSRKPSINLKEALDQPPSNLRPSSLEILIKGKLTSRGIAATLFDLGRRGHLTINQTGATEFRFARKVSPDKLNHFETELLDQIFGPLGNNATSEEINLSLSEELFSQKISRAYKFAYDEIQELGYFNTSPLALHRRYLVTGLVMFFVSLIGFFGNLLILPDIRYSLLLWIGMAVVALMVGYYSKDIPARTIIGQRELAKWSSFAGFLASKDKFKYTPYAEGKYLTYLPYAIVMDIEVDWSDRFIGLPFSMPGWYYSTQITSIEEFASRAFPMFGYLSYILSQSVKPTAR